MLLLVGSLDNSTPRSTVSLRMGTFCNNELGVPCSSAKTPSICRGITGRRRHYFNCSCALCSIASTRPCVVISSVLCSSVLCRHALCSSVLCSSRAGFTRGSAVSSRRPVGNSGTPGTEPHTLCSVESAALCSSSPSGSRRRRGNRSHRSSPYVSRSQRMVGQN